VTNALYGKVNVYHERFEKAFSAYFGLAHAVALPSCIRGNDSMFSKEDGAQMTTDEPLVSIGMPVYNGGPFVKEALDSLLAQDYPNFELIISDNASTDGTRELCLDYARRDSRVRYYRNSENIGSVENFKRVFALAKGEYFAWAAADDLWEPTYFSAMVRLLDDNADAVFAFSAFNNINEQGEELRQFPHVFDLPSDNMFQRLNNYIEQDEYLGKANPLYGVVRRQALEIGGYALWGKGEYWGADYHLVFRLLSLGELVLSKEMLFHKRLVLATVLGQAGFLTVSGQCRYFAGYTDIILALESLTAVEKMRLRMIAWRRLSWFCWNYARKAYIGPCCNRISAHLRQLVWLCYSWVTRQPLLYAALRALKKGLAGGVHRSTDSKW
jgi:glycosyltransferase involved in cell wall biosynthesis